MNDSRTQVLPAFSLLDTLQKEAQAAMPECKHGRWSAKVSLRLDGANMLEHAIWVTVSALHLPTQRAVHRGRITSQDRIEEAVIDLVRLAFDTALADLLIGLKEADL